MLLHLGSSYALSLSRPKFLHMDMSSALVPCVVFKVVKMLCTCHMSSALVPGILTEPEPVRLSAGFDSQPRQVR